jgi:AcrR family transcriptional regulator
VTSDTSTREPNSLASLDDRVLDAAAASAVGRGFDAVTIDDIASGAGVSRATVYRLFPGGRDVLFEALRVRETSRLLDDVHAEVAHIDDLAGLVVGAVVAASAALRNDEALADLLAAEPGATLGRLTVDGLPRAVAMASRVFAPLLAPHLDSHAALSLVDVLARLTLSHFLAPSDIVDMTDADSVRDHLTPFIAAATANTTGAS